jgi:hypothetical protein
MVRYGRDLLEYEGRENESEIYIWKKKKVVI